MKTKSYVSKKEYKPQYVRTVEADQTAYSKDNHAGFWLFLAAMVGMAAWAASVIF